MTDANDELTGQQRAILLDVARLMSQRRSVGEVFAAFSRRLLQAAAFDYTALVMIEDDPRYVRIVGTYPFQMPPAIPGAVFTERSMGISNLPEGPEGTQYRPAHVGTQSGEGFAQGGFERVWSARMLSGSRTIGAITVARKDPRRFSKLESAFLAQAGQLLGTALAQDIELANARREGARAALLNDLALLLNQGGPIEHVFGRVQALLEGALDFDYVSLMTRVGDTKRMVMVGSEPEILRKPGDTASFAELDVPAEQANLQRVLEYRTDRIGFSDMQAFQDAGILRMASIYLETEGEVIGMFTIGRRYNRAFTAPDTAFMATVGGMLSQAIANERRFERAQRDGARAELLNSLALLVNAGEPVERLFDRILALLEQAIRFEYVSLMVRPGDAQALMMVGTNPVIVRPVGQVIPFEELAIAPRAPDEPVVRQYRPARVDTVGGRGMAAAGIGRLASVVLEEGGEPMAMFSLGRAKNEPFDGNDVALIETVSAMLGQAIANQRRLERTQREAARAGLLNELAVLLNAGEPPATLFERLVERLRPALAFDHISLLLAEAGGRRVRAVGAITHTQAMTLDNAGQAFAVEGLPLERILRDGQLTRQFEPGRFANEMTEQVAAAGIGRVLTIVLRDDDEFVGLLNVGRARREPFAPDEVEFTEVLGSLVGQALVNHLRLERAEQNAARSVLLNEIAVLLSRGESFERMFDRAIGLLGPVVPFDHASMYLADASAEGRFRLVGVSPAGAEAAPSFTLEEIEFDASRAIHSIVRFFDPLAVASIRPDALAQGLTTGALCLLQDGADFFGFFSLSRRDPAGFRPEEAKFLEVVTTLFAQSLAQARRLARAEAEAARRRLLNELSILLNNGEAVGGLFLRLPELLAEAIEFDQVGLAVRADLSQRFQTFNWNRGQGPGGLGRWADESRANIAAIEAVGQRAFQFEPRAESAGIEAGFVTAGLHRVAVALLRHASESVGVLNVARASGRPFAQDEMEFLALVGQLMAQAIANQLRLVRSAAEAEDQRIVAEAASLAAREPNPREITRVLGERLRDLVPEPVVAYAIVEDGQMVLSDDELGELSFPIGRRLVEAIELGQSAGRADEQSLPRAVLERLESLGATAWSASSALVGGQVIGLLMVLSRGKRYRFGERELRLLREVAQAIGPAISNAVAEERARQEAREQRILGEVAAVAAREAGTRALAAALGPSLAAFIPDSSIQFAFIDGDRLLYHEAGGATRHMPFGPYVRAAIEVGQVSVHGLPDDLSPAARAMLGAAGVNNHVLTAARSAGATIGLLVAGTRDPNHVFSARDCALLERVASIVGPAMANGLAAERSAAEATEQRIVAAIAAAAASESNPHRLVSAVLRPLLELVPRPFLAYGYIENDALVFPAPDGRVERYPRGVMGARVDEAGQFVVEELPEELVTLRRWDVHSAVGTAARAGGATVGILVTGSREPGYVFGERELRIFRLVAQIIGAGMETARAAQRAMQEAEEQRLLAELAAVAARAPDDQALLLGIVEPLRRVIPRPAIAFAFIDGGDAIHVAPVRGQRIALHPAELRARDTGQVTLNGMPDDMPFEHPGRAVGTQSAILTATYSAGRPTGLLYVGTRAEGHTLGEREERLFRLIAQIVGPAMENARRAAEAARLTTLYQLMFGSLSEAVILLDHDLRTVFANKPGEDVIAMIDPERELRTVDEHTARMSPPIAEAFERAATGTEPTRGRGEVKHDGVLSWYDFEVVPLDDPNYRLLIVASDVTETVQREQMEEAQREQMQQASRLAALGELIGGVAHELNNPLTAILGFAEVLSLSSANEGIAEEVGIIQKEALRARNIVRDLLLIARPGRVEPSLVDLQAVVDHVERLRRNSWAQERIDVNVEFGGPDCHAWGNENQLTQVLLNLVTNAEHATEGCERRAIAIRTQRTDGQVLLEVSDNGAGMDEATAARVFEPFFTTKQGQGTGLGLSMSYSIVRAHNGTIDVQSRVGQGTTFRIVLPAAQAEAAPRQPEPAAAPATRVRVLVVDDEPSLRKVCQRLVTSMGHDCSVAGTASEAIAQASADAPDLILCDYRLATETADEVVNGIAARDPALLERIVIATGATTDAGVLRLTERFGLRLIAKPYGFEEIARLIHATTAPESIAS